MKKRIHFYLEESGMLLAVPVDKDGQFWPWSIYNEAPLVSVYIAEGPGLLFSAVPLAEVHAAKHISVHKATQLNHALVDRLHRMLLRDENYDADFDTGGQDEHTHRE